MKSSDASGAVRVERIVPLGPAMRRLTFAPEGLPQPGDQRPHGGHCRLIFPVPEGRTTGWPRAFTYRRWHEDGRFDVDFAVHDGAGPAARWLRQAESGQTLGWRHGGHPKVTLAGPSDDPATLVADATALPVVSALIETAHPDRPLRLVLLPEGAPPCPDFALRRNLEVLSFRTSRDAEECLCGTEFKAGLFFAAGEARQMRRLRRLALDIFGLAPASVVTSGYWKAGLTTEEVDAAKRLPDWFGDLAAI